MNALKHALRRNDGPVGDLNTRVYTIHASKGSESETVIVYDGITKRIAESVETNADERANEWRTWYVALTRSSKRLYVLRDGFDWMQSFLPERLGDLARRELNAANVEVAE